VTRDRPRWHSACSTTTGLESQGGDGISRANPDFTITVCSSGRHEKLIAELYYRQALFALISRAPGSDRLEIEFRPSRDGRPWRFPLAEMEEVIRTARERLRVLRSTS